MPSAPDSPFEPSHPSSSRIVRVPVRDEIVSQTADALVAKRTWRAEEDFYKGHYPGAPITPGVLLCESVFQAGALLLAGKFAGQGKPEGVPLLAKVENVRFRSPVYPGDTITIDVKINETAGGFYLMTGHIKKRRQARSERRFLRGLENT